MADNIIFITQENEFLRPYIQREMGKTEPSVSVMISSTDIYQPNHETIVDESGKIDATSPWAIAEQQFLTDYPDGIILRAASIVGTGMTGKVRRLAEEIYKARFFHFPGNEARKSVVHATDIARTVAYLTQNPLSSESPRIFNITDGINPTLHDLAEALVYRMSDKRISTLSTKPQQAIGRFLYGKRFREYTCNELFDSSAIRRILPFEPVDVCKYLRTHVYDESSL